MPRAALRKSHLGITLNDRSARMEQRVAVAIERLRHQLREDYGLSVEHDTTLRLPEIVSHLNTMFGSSVGLTFCKATSKENTFLRPDGGLLSVLDRQHIKRYILVTEAKRQGTNTLRRQEGKPRQAQGNAIERLRKNMQGIDCLFAAESITPFVCFGEGCDFEEESSILDRVSTMNSFFPLNTIFVDKIYVNDPVEEIFKPTSLFFREEPWSPGEMLVIMMEVCQRAIEYYDSKYELLIRRRGSTV